MRTTQSRLFAFVMLAILTLGLADSGPAQTIDPSLRPEEIKAIAQEVYIWGYPLVSAREEGRTCHRCRL